MNNNFNFNKLTPFKWYVLENFPFIEADFDAITEWQLFCKLGNEINKVIDSQNLVGEQVETLTDAFNNLKDYVDNYFENLDVQEEINNKLNEMVEDGTFSEIIGPYLNEFNNELNAQRTYLESEIAIQNNKINSLNNFPPIPVSSVSDMTDETKIYVLTTNGYWYYYNGTEFVQGGLYNSDLSFEDLQAMQQHFIIYSTPNITLETTNLQFIVDINSGVLLTNKRSLQVQENIHQVFNKEDFDFSVGFWFLAINYNTKHLKFTRGGDQLTENDCVIGVLFESEYKFITLIKSPNVYYNNNLITEYNYNNEIVFSSPKLEITTSQDGQTISANLSSGSIFTNKKGYFYTNSIHTDNLTVISNVLQQLVLDTISNTFKFINYNVNLKNYNEILFGFYSPQAKSFTSLINELIVNNVDVKEELNKGEVAISSSQLTINTLQNGNTISSISFANGSLIYTNKRGYYLANGASSQNLTTTSNNAEQQLIFDTTNNTFELKQFNYVSKTKNKVLLGYYKPRTKELVTLCKNIIINGENQNTKELIFNKNTAKIFKKACCVGDSYTAGYIVDSNDVVHDWNPDYAFPHYMELITGNEWINCGVSGATSKSWLTNENGLLKAQNLGKVQCYVVGLMINDSSDRNHVDVGVISDIGTNNDTYYAYYSKIIRELNTISPNAKIFIETCPKDDDTRYSPYNQAVRDIYNTYKNTYPVHLLDLRNNMNLYTATSITQDAKSGHYTAIGYEQFAEILNYIISDYIDNNITDFQDVAFIEYDN